MNLSYIVNNIKSIIVKNNVLKTIHHAITTMSADGAVADCSGCNTMSIRILETATVIRTFNIFVEGEIVSGSNQWLRIPVYNSKRIKQPYISIIKSHVSHNGYLANFYFANLSGFSTVRTRLEYIEGTVGAGVESVISNAPFQLEREPVTVRELNGLDTLTTRSYEFIGRPFGTEGPKTDNFNLYPIWIGESKFCEIIIKNNMNKTMRIMSISMHDDIAVPISTKSFTYYLDEILIPAGDTVKINSIEYPMLIAYLGLSVYLGVSTTETGTTTGTYDIKINVR